MPRIFDGADANQERRAPFKRGAGALENVPGVYFKVAIIWTRQSGGKVGVGAPPPLSSPPTLRSAPRRRGEAKWLGFKIGLLGNAPEERAPPPSVSIYDIP